VPPFNENPRRGLLGNLGLPASGLLGTQKPLCQENVPNCVQTLNSCSANISVSVPTRGGASALCVEWGAKEEEGKDAQHD
jgi:hypothetical protein